MLILLFQLLIQVTFKQNISLEIDSIIMMRFLLKINIQLKQEIYDYDLLVI